MQAAPYGRETCAAGIWERATTHVGAEHRRPQMPDVKLASDAVMLFASVPP